MLQVDDTTSVDMETRKQWTHQFSIQYGSKTQVRMSPGNFSDNIQSIMCE